MFRHPLPRETMCSCCNGHTLQSTRLAAFRERLRRKCGPNGEKRKETPTREGFRECSAPTRVSSISTTNTLDPRRMTCSKSFCAEGGYHLEKGLGFFRFALAGDAPPPHPHDRRAEGLAGFGAAATDSPGAPAFASTPACAGANASVRCETRRTRLYSIVLGQDLLFDRTGRIMFLFTHRISQIGHFNATQQ